jgi:hypothetical protein
MCLSLSKGTTPGKDSEGSPSPPVSMLPREPERARCSQSSKTTTKLRRKSPAFSHNVERSRSAVELTTPAAAASRPTIRRVGGVDFEMMSPSQSSLSLPPRSTSAEPPRSKSAEPPRARYYDEDHVEENKPQYGRLHSPRSHDEQNSEDYNFQHRQLRSSCPQFTREERSDSTLGYSEGDIAKPPPAVTNPSSAEAENQRPRSKLKKKNSNESMAPRPLIPRVTRSTAATPMTTPTPTTSPTQSVDDGSDGDVSDDSDRQFISNATARQLGNPPRRADSPIQSIRVSPPVHVAGLTGLVWASPQRDTSRPIWSWYLTKRWICCKCSAHTIVEQRVCARLTCGHHVCGDQCKMINFGHG